jgi:hypothetical protein
MAEYPTQEQLRDPNFVMPLEFAAPQDRGESAPAANPAPGPGNETEPDVEHKEFVVAEADFKYLEDDDDYDNDKTSSVKSSVSKPHPVDAPASRGGGVEVQGVKKGK